MHDKGPGHNQNYRKSNQIRDITSIGELRFHEDIAWAPSWIIFAPVKFSDALWVMVNFWNYTLYLLPELFFSGILLSLVLLLLIIHQGKGEGPTGVHPAAAAAAPMKTPIILTKSTADRVRSNQSGL